MAKSKLALKASPTFPRNVAIPVPGAGTSDVEFIFKHRTRDGLRDFLKELPGRENDVEVILDIASGWDLEDPFDAESIATLTQNYPGSAAEIVETYINELSGARLGNLRR